mgnify:CR=1 FL=1
MPPRPPHRIALALACLVFPGLVYGLSFYLVGGKLLTPQALMPETLGVAFGPATPARFAADMAARERFLIAAAAMTAVSLGALAFSLSQLVESRGPRFGLLAAVGATATGLFAVATQGNPLRDLAVERPVALAIREGATWGLAEAWAGISLLVTANTFIGLVAVGATALRFADLALGRDGPAPDAAALARNGRALRETVLAGSAILTSATVATVFFNQYPLSLMAPPALDVFTTLSGIASVRWGAAYSIVLATAAAPAAAALIADRRRAAASGLRLTDEETRWLSRDGLVENLKTLSAVAGVLAPALAAPAIEIVKAFAG